MSIIVTSIKLVDCFSFIEEVTPMVRSAKRLSGLSSVLERYTYLLFAAGGSNRFGFGSIFIVFTAAAIVEY